MNKELSTNHWLTRVSKILAKHESSPSRVVLLEDLPKKLNGKPVDIQNYFNEAIRCLEHELIRAGIVLSWSGFIHVLVEHMYINYEDKLRKVRSKWSFQGIEELKEYNEHQLIEVAKVLTIINKAEKKKYIGQLATRNQCAHPTLFNPSLNSGIGFVDNMIYQAEKYL